MSRRSHISTCWVEQQCTCRALTFLSFYDPETILARMMYITSRRRVCPVKHSVWPASNSAWNSRHFEPRIWLPLDYKLEVTFNPDTKPVLCKLWTVSFTILKGLITAYGACIKKSVWVVTQFNESGTPVVPIWKAFLPGQQKA